MFGDKSQHHQAQDLVPHQGYVAAALEVAETNLALGDAKRMLDIPAAKRDPQQRFHRRLGRGIREEVLHLPGHRVAGHDQPIGAGRQVSVPSVATVANQVNLPRTNFPFLDPQASNAST